jgi:BirA family biotin operon repressor/biotin-[acetyl-CoA-carboxylase] ligase
MFSCAFAVDLPIAELPGLSPAMGIAACEALRALISAQASATSYSDHEKRLQLKWPNDLLWDGAKLAGILVESATMPGSKTPVIVAGIGLNLKDAAVLSETLERPIADWSQIAQTGSVGAGSVGAGSVGASSVDAGPAHTGTPEVDPAQIVASIASAWLRAISEYAAGGYAAFHARFDAVDALADLQVDVTDKGHILQTGQASGTDSIGRLLLQTDRGISAIMVGDVSIRPSAPRTGTAHFAPESQS